MTLAHVPWDTLAVIFWTLFIGCAAWLIFICRYCAGEGE